MKSLYKVIICAACVAILATVAMAADPFVGTWKMNPAKSKSELKSFTMKIEAEGNSIKTVQDMVSADGNATHRSWTYKNDGKDYPIVGDPNADTNSVTKPNPNTVKYVFKKNGKKIDSGQAVVSKDGKTHTAFGRAKNANGKAFTYTLIMEKQ